MTELLVRCSHLEDLNLFMNPVENDGVKKLAPGLKHVRSLKRLNLRYAGIVDEGAKVLAQVLHNCTALEEVDLLSTDIDGRITGVGDDGIPRLGFLCCNNVLDSA